MGGDKSSGGTSKEGIQVERGKLQLATEESQFARGIMTEQNQRSRKSSEQTMPVLEQMSQLIQSALKGDVDKFASSPIAQRKASMTAQAGAKRSSGAQRQLAQKGLDKSGAGMAYMNDLDAQTSGAVLDSVLSEMTRYLDIAPGFGGMAAGGGVGGIPGMGGGGQANLAPYAALEAQNRQSGRNQTTQIASSVGMVGGAVIGSYFGGPAGGMLGAAAGSAAGGAIGSIF